MPDKVQIKEYAIKIYNAPAEILERPNMRLCLRRIKGFCRNALRDDSGANTVSAKWLSDNYYVIEREIKFLMKASEKEFPMSSRLYSYAEKLFFFTEYELNVDVVSSFFEVFSRGDFLTDSEISNVQNVMKAVLIHRIYQLCGELEGKNGFDILSAHKALADERLAGNLITSLRKSSIIDFGSYVMGYSPIERMFRLDPAGIYTKMDKPTQLLYRKKLEKLSRRRHKGKTEILKEILEKCSSQRDGARHIGFYLFEKPDCKPYIAGIVAVFFVLYAVTVYLCRGIGLWLIPSSVLFVIPLFESAVMLCDRIFSKLKKPEVIPKMKFDSFTGIPDDCRTLTVITSLLFGGKEDEKLFSRLERFYLANRDKNLFFGILGDLAESDSPTNDGDDSIIQSAADSIRRLNEKYGGGFYMFIRRRVYSKTQKCYMGYERKRGAVIELCRLLRTKDTTISFTGGDMSLLEGVKYVLTLDADTDVGMGQLAQLCGAMAHPLNKPVFKQKDGREYVESGYGIMQPLMSYALVPSGKTPFCVLKSGAGGRDIYPSAAFDIYQSFFGSGMFCGKGIFDVDAFMRVIDGAFPDESVLSHDILEGCLLRCASVGDVVFTDSLPHNPISYFKREHRWARGDVQAMAFAGGSVVDAYGRKSKSPLSALSRYKLWRNIFRMLLPLCGVLGLFLALLCGHERVAVPCLLYLFIPFIWDGIQVMFSRRFQQIFRKFDAHVISGIWSALLNLFYDIATLFHRALINTDALVRGVWRMKVSRQKMLEWTTALEADKIKNKGITAYLAYMKYSVIAGILLVIPHGGFVRFAGVMFVLSPLICTLLSRPIKVKKGMTHGECSAVTEYCRDMWKFFSREVNAAGNHLPPDNVQFSPVYARAERCSPTNLGLYLLSVLAARDFNFIGNNQVYERIRDTLDTVDKLEKWHGHLFNWYDNRTLETVGAKYVSTVDSGNFVTALSALERGLEQYATQDGRLLLVMERIRKIIDKTDFRALYNPSRDLFYLGYNADSESMGEGCYDLFMSEARTTSYFAVARGDVPKRHWSAIGRILISRGFYIGAASWTGTTFEYFMPTLLLPVYRNSFSYEALEFAFREQRRHYAQINGNRVWGSSECGFYEFDAQMNYQYKAIGAPFLSLKHEESEELVISPYSSFLMMERSPHKVLENLENLKKLGMYSRYGFFEAVDFTPSRAEGDYAVVESYMAHHVGMSIIACANSVYDGIFRRRFMSDPQMACASELLEEKIPTDANIFNDIDAGDIPEKRTKAPYGLKSEHIDAKRPRIALLGGYRSTLRVSDCGHVWLERHGERRNRCVNAPPSDITSLRPSFVVATKINGRLYSPIREICSETARVNFEYDRDSTHFNITDGGRLVNVAYRLSAQTCVMYADISVSCREGDITEYMLYFEPVLESLADYTAHPAFSALSVEAEYDAVRRILIFHRRSRKAGGDLYLAAGLAQEDVEYSFETRTDKLFEAYESVTDILKSDEPLSCATGACICPRVYIKVKPRGERKRNKNTEKLCFMVLCATERDKAVKAFVKARENYASQREADALAAANTKKALESSTDRMDISDYLLLERILRAVSFSQNGILLDKAMTQNFRREDIWKYSVSGDVPIVTVRVTHEEQLAFCGRMIMLHRMCNLNGLMYDLVFLTEETEAYNRPLDGGLKALTARCRSGYLVGKKGGLFFVSDKNATDIFKAMSCLWLEDTEKDPTPSNDAMRLTVPRVSPDRHVLFDEYDSVLETYGGDFVSCGFVIDKVNKKPPLAYAHVLSNRVFGTVITQNSLGYTWFSNSHERRLTRFENSAYDSFVSETVYMIGTDGLYDLCRMASYVQYGPCMAVYSGRAEDTEYRIELCVHSKMPAKLVRVTLSQQQRVFYAIRPAFTHGTYYVKGKNSILFGSLAGSDRGLLFMPSQENCRLCTSIFEMMSDTGGINDMAIAGAEGTQLQFALCSANSEKSAEYLQEALRKISFEDIMVQSLDMTKDILKGMMRESSAGDSALKIMSDFWLAYQAVFCRFFARGALYQSGGAYGYRDQLQDCRIFFKNSPRFARRHIIRCAAHQFEEGDAQHWWHNVTAAQGRDPGIRSRCSDDYLWLVLVACEYVEETGDDSLWDVKVRYLSDSPLAGGETERYSVPGISDVKETVYEHCKRAVALFEKRGLGAHGLPFIGSCDWNDGFSAVGEAGKGESVWLAFFARIILEKFALAAKKRGDNYKDYHRLSDLLGENIDKNAYNGKWFLRGFYDDGTPLGDESCDECKIDLLPQAFSAMCDGLLEKLRPTAYRSDKKRISTALDFAYKYLYDKENRILKLFSPPFARTEKNPGYIKSYAAGLRENGGQYTHAAIWGGMGFYAGGQRERALEITRALCPALRAQDEKLFENYKTEPYVLCGDVYANPSHPARGGWSWYTGSAAWYIELIRLQNGKNSL